MKVRLITPQPLVLVRKYQQESRGKDLSMMIQTENYLRMAQKGSFGVHEEGA